MNENRNIQNKISDVIRIVCITLFLSALLSTGIYYIKLIIDDKRLDSTNERLVANVEDNLCNVSKDDATNYDEVDMSYMLPVITMPDILPQYKEIYGNNPDFIGWLKIEDTIIDYPVVQTPNEEDKYLSLDFDGNENVNGTLILDSDSSVGLGRKENCYLGHQSVNMIIHGHTMKSGKMFGKLKLYADEEYGKGHKTIQFDTLYEERKYELIAVFYSKVYKQSDDCFKYYEFFEADNEEEFEYFYKNIKDMSLYDTGVQAKFGDEFITLSCCAYHTENGRFVVVAKRTE